MNFFGHAAAASLTDGRPAFGFGAMLPDLLGMSGVDPEAVHDPVVVAGRRFHVETDGVFHRLPVFVGLLCEGSAGLGGLGLRRGPARAAAHVAIELLLDGVLSEDPRLLTSFEQSLSFAAKRPAPLAWRSAGDRRRWAALQRRLRRGPLPRAYREGSFVAGRVHAVLGRRRRLALHDEELPGLHAWVAEAAPRVRRESKALFEDLMCALAAA